jgi:hypothetical protein
MTICPKCEKQELEGDEKVCPRCANKKDRTIVKSAAGGVLLSSLIWGAFKIFSGGGSDNNA